MKTWKEYPSLGEWLKHCEYYSAIKKSHTTDTWKYLDESQKHVLGKEKETHDLISLSTPV